MNLHKIYSLVWGQVINALRKKLRTCDTFYQVNLDSDSLALLVMLRTICFSDSDNEYTPDLSTR